MARRPAVTGSTPQERREKREQRARVNQLNFFAARHRNARNGREAVVAACTAVQAVGKDLTDEGRRKLAAAVFAAIQAVDSPENRKTKP